MSVFTHIAVVGAGAVGCYFGGMLARAGLKVTLIGRKNHVDAILKNGLRMSCQTFEDHQAILASTEMSAIQSADLILVCVKSPDSEACVEEMKPHLKKDAVILSLQNGVDNAQRIQGKISQNTYAAVVYVATTMAGDGHLKHFGRGELIIGQPKSKLSTSTQSISQTHQNDLLAISELFNRSSVPTEISQNIEHSLWSKFLVNCSYNAISAIGQKNYGDMTKLPDIWKLIETLTIEFLAVAKAEGIDIAFDDAMKMNEQIKLTMTGQKSSTAQDLSRNRPTEIDFLNGLIVQRGKEHGVLTPTHETIYTLVKLLELKKSACAV